MALKGCNSLTHRPAPPCHIGLLTGNRSPTVREAREDPGRSGSFQKTEETHTKSLLDQVLENDPSWSPDGRLAFGRNDLSNPAKNMFLQIYDPKTGKISRVDTPEPVFAPRWSPDGKSMAVIAFGNTRSLLLDVETQKLRTLAEEIGLIGYLAWSPDSAYVYFDTLLNPKPGYYRVRVKDGKIDRLVDLKPLRMFDSQFGPGSWTGIDPNRIRSSCVTSPCRRFMPWTWNSSSPVLVAPGGQVPHPPGKAAGSE